MDVLGNDDCMTTMVQLTTGVVKTGLGPNLIEQSLLYSLRHYTLAQKRLCCHLDRSYML